MRTVASVTADEVVHADRRHLLDALMQLYLHDFSEYAPLTSSYGEIDETGRFAYRWLYTSWQDTDRIALLIRADGRIAGFVLVNRWSALDRPIDHAVAEFFVLRKYRRAGVGTHVALSMFGVMPGRWEIPVASYNAAALAFWRHVGRLLPVPVHEQAGDGDRWSGQVLSFTAAPGAGRLPRSRPTDRGADVSGAPAPCGS